MESTTPEETQRPRCSVFIATSVDGFIARKDGSIDWLSSVELPGEDYGFAEFYASVDALVMGRATYEVARSFETWPYGGKRCLVLTHRPAEPLHGEEFVDADPVELVRRLGREGIRHVYVDGGSVVRQFADAGLVDAITLSIVPVALGSGIRLFEDGGAELRLQLSAVRSWPSGLVQMHYETGRGDAVR